MCIAEMAEPDQRGQVLGRFPLSIVTGILISYLVGLAVCRLPGGISVHWRALYGLVLLPSAVLLFAALRVSPPEAEDTEDEVVGSPGTERLLHEEIDQEAFTLTARDIVFAIGIAACQQLTGINAIISYAPGIFVQAGSSDPTVNSVVPNIINVICTLISGNVVDRFGRRPLLLISILVMTLSLFSIAASFLFIGGTAKSASVMVPSRTAFLSHFRFSGDLLF